MGRVSGLRLDTCQVGRGKALACLPLPETGRRAVVGAADDTGY